MMALARPPDANIAHAFAAAGFASSINDAHA
jgi:hypothetical protein